MISKVILAVALAVSAAAAMNPVASPMLRDWTFGFKDYTNGANYGVRMSLVDGNNIFLANSNGTFSYLNGSGMPLWANAVRYFGDDVTAWVATSEFLFYSNDEYYGSYWKSNGTLAWSTAHSTNTQWMVKLNDEVTYLFASDKVLKINVTNGNIMNSITGHFTPYYQPTWIPGGIVCQGSSTSMYLYNLTSDTRAWMVSSGNQWSTGGIQYLNGTIYTATYERLFTVDAATGATNTIKIADSSDDYGGNYGMELIVYANNTDAVAVVRFSRYIVSYNLNTKAMWSSKFNNSGYVNLWGPTVMNKFVIVTDYYEYTVTQLCLVTGTKMMITKVLDRADTSSDSAPLKIIPVPSGNAMYPLDFAIAWNNYLVYINGASWAQTSRYKQTYNLRTADLTWSNETIVVTDGYGNAAAANFAGTIPARFDVVADSTITTSLLNTANTFYFGTSSKIYAVGENGTTLFSTDITGTSTAGKPVRSGNRIWFVGGGTFTGRVMSVDMFTGAYADVADVNSKCTNSPTTIVADDEEGYIYFSCATSRIYRVDATEPTKLVESCQVDFTVYREQPPVIGTKTVFATSNLGRVAGIPKTGFSVTAAKGVCPLWTSEYVADEGAGPVFYDGYVFGTDDNVITALSGTTGKTVWKNTNKDSTYNAAPFLFNKMIYTVDNKGRVSKWQPVPTKLTAELEAGAVWTMATRATANYRGFAVTDNGAVVVSDDDGVYGVDSTTGASLWNITVPEARSCAAFQYRTGILFATCSVGTTLIDTVNGRVWMSISSSNFAPSSFVAVNNTLYYADGKVFSEFQLAAPLYKQGEVPGVVPGPDSGNGSTKKDDDDKKKKIIIAVVVVVVVLILLVVVIICIKKRSAAAQSDGEYVPMQGGPTDSRNV